MQLCAGVLFEPHNCLYAERFSFARDVNKNVSFCAKFSISPTYYNRPTSLTK